MKKYIANYQCEGNGHIEYVINKWEDIHKFYCSHIAHKANRTWIILIGDNIDNIYITSEPLTLVEYLEGNVINHNLEIINGFYIQEFEKYDYKSILEYLEILQDESLIFRTKRLNEGLSLN